MLYEDYESRAKQVAAYVDAGSFSDALKVLQSLLDSDISDLDKSMMSINMAVVYEKMEQPERALEWYDRGISFEAVYLRFFVPRAKPRICTSWAITEIIDIYQDLSEQSFLTEVDKLRMQQNIHAIKTMMADTLRQATKNPRQARVFCERDEVIRPASPSPLRQRNLQRLFRYLRQRQCAGSRSRRHRQLSLRLQRKDRCSAHTAGRTR